jgi:hypothetical protein
LEVTQRDVLRLLPFTHRPCLEVLLTLIRRELLELFDLHLELELGGHHLVDLAHPRGAGQCPVDPLLSQLDIARIDIEADTDATCANRSHDR